MSVLVCFHAHPDDEVFGTGGVIRLAADAGHRVVLVTATDGALGEDPDGVVPPGESLVAHRRAELEASAQALGVHRLVMLDYPDSGMAGTPENANPAAFANLPVAQPARRLADILIEESADVVTFYDSNGGYGHPDHVAVHHVGRAAAELASTPHRFESVANRDRVRAMMAANPAWDEEQTGLDMDSFGVPDSEITVEVDVSAVMEAKRAAMVAHATQIGDFGPFLQMPIDMLRTVFGVESFRHADGAPRPRMTSLPL
ncbi:PIG-L deacetylase family protein [Williamsia sp. CHRR-6]|uniref:PIG-L deacetylase family protein n=1 Tax=Williamsia sp. CHRR-6 TaxID=2835871 RepID=UPI001BDB393F|nr:PIG-L family deacetylase [Williamsia sp. CHRR-6]MBT0567118.1 PIG-L family deacetylase [Williamsia sp. CHRR-6]